MYNRGEVWFVEFPLEEDNSQTINRPVVVLDDAKDAAPLAEAC